MTKFSRRNSLALFAGAAASAVVGCANNISAATVPTPSTPEGRYKFILRGYGFNPDKVQVYRIRVEMGDSPWTFLEADGLTKKMELSDYAVLLSYINPCSGGYNRANGMVNMSYDVKGVDGKVTDSIENYINLPVFNPERNALLSDSRRKTRKLSLEEALTCK